MIKTLLQTNDNTILSGGEELIAQWRAQPGSYIWIDLLDVESRKEEELLESLDCHPLAIEDIQRHRHPPKTETFNKHTFILYRGITEFRDDLTIDQMTIALFAGSNCLISCHPSTSKAIDYWWQHVRDEELLKSPGLLATLIMHFSVGRYLEAILDFEPKLNELEDSMQERPDDEMLREVIAYKSRLRKLKRIFSYHERLATSLLKNIPPRFMVEDGDIHHALQDLFERCERLHSLCTMYYEICGDLIEGYLSITSHMLNNTMRILTVITAIFVPLTFIAGIYGMNFEYMPELGFAYSYFIVIGIMLVMAATMLGLFRYKRWL
jgi:magnesium transporter